MSDAYDEFAEKLVNRVTVLIPGYQVKQRIYRPFQEYGSVLMREPHIELTISKGEADYWKEEIPVMGEVEFSKLGMEIHLYRDDLNDYVRLASFLQHVTHKIYMEWGEARLRVIGIEI